jgi:hypothetical protein
MPVPEACEHGTRLPGQWRIHGEGDRNRWCGFQVHRRSLVQSQLFQLDDQLPHRQHVGQLAQLKQNGVDIVKSPDADENGTFAWVLDPDGNKVELWESGEQHQAK